MKQLLQSPDTGEITVADVPAPQRSAASLLVATRYSLISAGTERALIELGVASIAGKARARPDLVKKVLAAARTEGVKSTYDKVRARLGEPTTPGYSLCGEVVEACDDAPAGPGELVACAGAGHAVHAEFVSVPRNLCARLVAGVSPEDAAYSTVASIALHGFRLAECQIGDVVAVLGLGLVGQLALDIVAAAGCVPFGLDLREDRAQLAVDGGHRAVTDPREFKALIDQATSRRGADSVLVVAASKSAAPLATATAVARERATVCIVGDVPIESDRGPLFSKELRLVVSRSYGPGRYDPTYELKGVDYPASYVRWTEGRNLEEVVRLMATGHLRPSRLTTHTFDIADGGSAYQTLMSGESSMGILLRYPIGGTENAEARTIKLPARRGKTSGRPRIGVIGAGSFARSVLLPRLLSQGEIVGIANATGPSAVAAADRFSAHFATTEADRLFDSPEIDAIVIATRHDSHADLTIRALQAGKHVFVEKPLALTPEQLSDVEAAAAASAGILMVGFNRRFAPLAQRLRRAVATYGPALITYRVNAGAVPMSHWTHDPDIGGGRIVGEVCHFVDFAAFLTDTQPVSVAAFAVEGSSQPRQDNVAALLNFADGSIASIHYTSLGDPSLPKERIEVFGRAGAAVLDDFAALTLHVGGEKERIRSRKGKGHSEEIETFLQACASGEQPWPLADMAAVMRATFQIRAAVDAAEHPVG